MEEEEERMRRQKEEELLRQQRIEEERRKVEEERRRMEEERKAEEERKRKAEEAKKAAEEKKRQEKAAKEAAAAAAAAAKAASAMVAAAATGAFTATPAPPAAKKSPSKVSLMDADEFMALKQSPKQQPARVEPMRPDKPQGPVWGSKASQPVQTSALSLAEIQRMQEEKERSLAEERAQQLRKQQQQQAMQQALFLQQQQQQPQKSTLTWASRAQAPPVGSVVKSLSEIQQEEAERADKMRKAQQQQRQQQQQMRQQESSVLQLSGAWGTTSNSLLKSFNNSFQYLDMVQDEDNTRGFWDEAVTATPAPKSTSKPATSDGSFPSLAGNPVVGASSSRSSKSQQSKKAEEQVMKLFEVHAKAAPTDELTAWCVQVLGGIQSYLDIPTVVAILKDVESPAEVQEYVHNFFGNSLDTKDFVQQFLQRRERYLKSCSSVPRPEDTFTLAASSIASMAAREASAATQGDGFTAARSKKKKKSKMQKVDSSLLGFTVQADPARLNAGEIDRVEGI